mmetsp:Transcript_11170/g.18772  ORF Transcript_11170/g.18772 Transcript_11170/m.18772 type:complete len:80 (-) Transcript_11170:825-1064(-)
MKMWMKIYGDSFLKQADMPKLNEQVRELVSGGRGNAISKQDSHTNRDSDSQFLDRDNELSDNSQINNSKSGVLDAYAEE